MLRRRSGDPPFLRDNLKAALQEGAACEVDLVMTADGHAVCLHDLMLDRETTGTGPVSEATRAQIERLRMRGLDGAPLPYAPLFLDEIAATVEALGARAPAIVQLDIKSPWSDITGDALNRFSATLGATAPAFIAGGGDWSIIEELAAAVPGLHKGFDPLLHYPRHCDLSESAFRSLGEFTFTTAPDASIFYLEAKLVLAGLAKEVNLVEMVTRNGAMVDAWTIDANRPHLRDDLRRLIEAGCGQITSNDPDILFPIIEELAVANVR
ncbi:glycerophosphodiester phosphodiesterase [Terrarubrum flagellatum]|uniref:glycerophosphodiester phosphodiesterase n=1 Tax=Terrirubrum flagellatum TaxID=2895980 RepID=UPI0031453468